MFPVTVFEYSLVPIIPIVFEGTLYNVRKEGSAKGIQTKFDLPVPEIACQSFLLNCQSLIPDPPQRFSPLKKTDSSKKSQSVMNFQKAK